MRQSRLRVGKAAAAAEGPGTLAELRVLALIQELECDSLDALPRFLVRVAALVQTLVSAPGVLIEVHQAGDDGTWRGAVGSARRFQVGGPRAVTFPLPSGRGQLGALTLTDVAPAGLSPEEEQLVELVTRMVAIRVGHLEQLRDTDGLLAENAIAIATLRQSEDRFRQAFDHSGIGMALMAGDGRWLKVNAALAKILGYSAAELLDRDSRSVTHPDDIGAEMLLTHRLIDGAIPSFELEKRYLHQSGRPVWALLTVSAVKDASGQVLYLVSQIQDISARKQAEEVLQRHAVRDSLTGLLNRREMDRVLDEEISRARRHGRALSLVMVDVDRFKQVNDSFGHQAGDRALQDVASVLVGCLRTHDQVARYGGEEFAIILPETTGADALAVAERMRMRVAAEVMARALGGPANTNTNTNIDTDLGDATSFPVTISVGIASLLEGDDEGEGPARRLFQDADSGLYVAKRSGRNRCVVTAPLPRGSTSADN